MKIRLAILESDQVYLNRLVSVFNSKFSEMMEVYSFTNENIAMSVLKEERIHVFLASESFEIDINRVPKQCAFAYLVNSSDIDSVNGQKVICKFQKADIIYRDILGIYSDDTNHVAVLKTGDEKGKILLFSSPSGGVGNSMMAAACAIRKAKQGKKVLFLNLELLGSSDVFFHAEGTATMSDVLFALKSKKSNLSFKLESCVKQDKSGVYFFSQPRFALDMKELGLDEMDLLLNEFVSNKLYDYIVVDSSFSLHADYFHIHKKADYVIWVNQGTDITNGKTYRALQACKTIVEDDEANDISKILVMYNKFSNKTCKIIDTELGIESLGGIPFYMHMNDEQVLEQLAGSELFDKLY